MNRKCFRLKQGHERRGNSLVSMIYYANIRSWSSCGVWSHFNQVGDTNLSAKFAELVGAE